MTDVTQEAGLGALLEQAVQIGNDHGKPEVKSVELPDGGKALLNLGHSGDVTTLEVIDPEALDHWRQTPLYVAGAPTLGSLDSLIDYVNLYKDEDSVVFASDDRSNPKIVAVLDYHVTGDNEGEATKPRFGRHTATFPVPLSDAWKGWNDCDGKVLQMAEFARFLEDHIVDVMDPASVELSNDQEKFVNTLGGRRRMADPAKLMELATGLQIFEAGQITQAQRLESGETQITIESEHRDSSGQKLEVPSMFTIAIPVFRNGPAYQIVARLRYRKGTNGILFFYELWRADKVFDHAFDEACEQVRDSAGVTVLRGTR